MGTASTKQRRARKKTEVLANMMGKNLVGAVRVTGHEKALNLRMEAWWEDEGR